MNTRHILVAAGVAVAAWFMLSGGSGNSGEAVTDGAADSTAGTESSPPPVIAADARQESRSSGQGKSENEPAIMILQPRDTLIGGARAETRGHGLYSSRGWVAPVPPPPPPVRRVPAPQLRLPPPPAKRVLPLPAPAPVVPPLPGYLGEMIDDNGLNSYAELAKQSR